MYTPFFLHNYSVLWIYFFFILKMEVESMIKNALLSLKKNIGKTILLFVIIVVITNLVIAGLSIQSATQKSAYIRQEGEISSVFLVLTNGNPETSPYSFLFIPSLLIMWLHYDFNIIQIRSQSRDIA